MSRPDIRPLLPQATAMTNFSFAPPNLGVGDTKKNYVFVDEHNRHKRLKVMRACDGCRRRKIKCDAATTNAWPCAACVRLKLTCVPPTVHYHPRANPGPPPSSGLERVLDFADSSGESGGEGDDEPEEPHPYSDYSVPSGDDEAFAGRPAKRLDFKRPDALAMSKAGYATNMAAFHPGQRQQQHAQNGYDGVTTPSLPSANGTYYSHPSWHSQASVNSTPRAAESSDSWSCGEFSVSSLQEVMGALKVHDNGTAPYIVLQKKTLAEAPAQEEAEAFTLPTIRPEPDSRVRIPPDLMPSDELALEYFEVFFAHVHPYVPVISQPYFYHLWRTNRSLISPLLLEAVFAAAGRYSSDPAGGLQWLAMASKHENAFMDVPRLSTIQALLILLKAREANPKRGYYYRSWMTLKTACTMAQDLELDEHYALHQAGRTCADPTDCRVKTRIWQAIFCGEIIIGGPQGRRDMSTNADTVDFGLPPAPSSGLDDDDGDETRTGREYVYLARACRSVRALADVYGAVMREPDWQKHPRLRALNPEFPQWLHELPPEMHIHYPEDGAAPWLESHFVGNVHLYYHLGILLLHRPQLMACSFATTSDWKEHMSISYDSAKKICRIQESLLKKFGINGLMYMQRAITVPDPTYNVDAKDYFVRHMRILESCMEVNPMADTRVQIDSLREAFSADVRQPFALKPTFPHGSPIAAFAPSPPPPPQPQPEAPRHATATFAPDPVLTGPQSAPPTSAHFEPPPHAHAPAPQQYGFHPLTPPISAGLEDAKEGPLALPANLALLPTSGGGADYGAAALDDDCAAWNPTRLFHQWHSAFGTPPSGPASAAAAAAAGAGQAPRPGQSPGVYSSTASTTSHDLPVGPPDAAAVAAAAALPPTHYPLPASLAPPAPQQSAAAVAAASYPGGLPPPTFVSPSMWQEAVASSYVPRDLKRRWDGAGGPAAGAGAAGWGEAAAPLAAAAQHQSHQHQHQMLYI